MSNTYIELLIMPFLHDSNEKKARYPNLTATFNIWLRSFQLLFP